MSSVQPHICPVGPRLRGPPVPDWLRCLNCGKSTRNAKRGSFLECTAGRGVGGRLCGSCKAALPPNCESLACTSWVELLLRKPTCQSCCKEDEKLVTCRVCDRELCLSCVVIESYNLMQHTGKDNILCYSCCPNFTRIKPRGRPGFCYFCLSDHSDFPGLPPCLDPDVDVLPLVDNLIEGRSVRQASSRHTSLAPSETSIAVSAVPEIPRTQLTNNSSSGTRLHQSQQLCPASGLLGVRSLTNSALIVGPDLPNLQFPVLPAAASSLTSSRSNRSLPASVAGTINPLPRLETSKSRGSHLSTTQQAQFGSTSQGLGSIPLLPTKTKNTEPAHPPTCRNESTHAHLSGFALNEFDHLLPAFDDRTSRIVNAVVRPLQQSWCTAAADIKAMEKAISELASIKNNNESSTISPVNDKCNQWSATDQNEAKKVIEDSQPIRRSDIREMFGQGTSKIANEIRVMSSSLSNTLGGLAGVANDRNQGDGKGKSNVFVKGKKSQKKKKS